MSQCGYVLRQAYGERRHCLNRAHWFIEYTTPDDGRTMRRRQIVVRCSQHTATKFLPNGASQIVTSRLNADGTHALTSLVTSPSPDEAAR